VSGGRRHGGRGARAALRAILSRVRERLGIAALDRRVTELHAAYAELCAAYERDIERAWQLLDGHEKRLGRSERLIQIATVMNWIEQATLRTEPRVSVVIPTRDRAAVLPRAIESVRAQSYSNWEVIVADDGSPEDTAAAVATFEDPRIRVVTGRPGGASAARNRGIAAANGSLIAYLDDDNRMHRHWLKAVVWAFEQRPDAEVLYGAIVIDDTSRLHGGAPEMPSAWLERYDRESIVEANIADTSAIAHRAELETSFDESLETMADWDFMLRATLEREPLMLPAIAVYYYTDVEDRLSDMKDTQRRNRAAITARARAARGLE
jgi:glycosyltransferase involved in cell wall biosynthesis